MNNAEQLLRKIFNYGDEKEQKFDAFEAGNFADMFHPNVQHSLFGPSGTKEILNGRDSFLAFIQRDSAALAGHSDEILRIIGIDEECALVHARAWRKSAATGEEIIYEWAMLYRIESGQITYGTDMLDSDAQAFWGRIHG